jgi:HEAT repeats
VCGLVLCLGTGSAAGSSVQDLIERLKNGEDFRVRVQAALQLGKSKSAAARTPLEAALDDENAAVRTASAAALKVLGDKRSIPALEQHKKDSSAAVRTQIEATLVALRATSAVTTPRMIVKLGKMRSSQEASGGKLVGDLEAASRQRFGELPGVKVVDANASDEEAKVKGKKIPMVMVTGSIRKLKESREGGEVVYSASVEYIVHRMPEQAIAGTVSGSASTTASRSEAKKRAFELKRLVLAAAVESAVKRAPEALAAATR